jgi:hypothetical protein
MDKAAIAKLSTEATEEVWINSELADKPRNRAYKSDKTSLLWKRMVASIKDSPAAYGNE